jgi:uncharacterized protein (DUF433 family)
MDTLTATPLIVETARGPCVAGRRTTVYTIFEHLNSGCSREAIKQYLTLSDEQLDAAIEYINEHRAEVEKDYAEIVRRSEERRAHYDKLFRERTRFDPDLPPAERARLLREHYLKRQQAAPPGHDDQDPARPRH